ncbi:hypothetical protein EDD17DRAFT_263099 [Pisolithus thermaeus]|nr:hypothetical protein EV401DRAFT_802019 [Pisolithus croceorrhizus]KAI6141582.1 hypothetical protein EDD17DRAFT_263099 [Pisolithus thermaeus]
MRVCMLTDESEVGGMVLGQVVSLLSMGHFVRVSPFSLVLSFQLGSVCCNERSPRVLGMVTVWIREAVGGSWTISASDDGEILTSPSNPHASPRDPPHSWFPVSLSYISSVSHHPRCAIHSTYYALETGKAADVRGGYGSRCDVCSCFVILTILSSPFPFVLSQTLPTPSALSPCGIVTLVQMDGLKKRFVSLIHVRSVNFSRLIPSPTSPFQVTDYVDAA